MQEQINTNQEFNQFASSYDELLNLMIENKVESEIFMTEWSFGLRNHSFAEDANKNIVPVIYEDSLQINNQKYKIDFNKTLPINNPDPNEIKELLSIFTNLVENLANDKRINFEEENFSKIVDLLDSTLSPIKKVFDKIYEDSLDSSIRYYNYNIATVAQYMWDNKIPFRFKPLDNN